jgi:hypothetical protein
MVKFIQEQAQQGASENTETQGEIKMATRNYTVQELASNRNLWEEYIDPDNNAPFDSMTQEERETTIREIWPDTPETTEE